MTYRIAIVDDNPADTAYVTSLCEAWAKETEHTLQIRAFPSAEVYLFQEEDEAPFDILLLDIEMGEMNGIELAHRVRERNRTVQMIFITGYPDFVAEGYEVSALHYLMKPVRREKLSQVLDRAVDAIGRHPRTILLTVGKETVRVVAEDILYAESQGHYVVLRTAREEYKCRMTVAELTETLGKGFSKCHRSFVVGLRHISRITKAAVFLTDSTELPLGKGLYDELNRALINTLREM